MYIVLNLLKNDENRELNSYSMPVYSLLPWRLNFYTLLYHRFY